MEKALKSSDPGRTNAVPEHDATLAELQRTADELARAAADAELDAARTFRVWAAGALAVILGGAALVGAMPASTAAFWFAVAVSASFVLHLITRGVVKWITP